jgi:hypothetical protein
LRIASQQAVGAPDERQAIRCWSQCALGERQIRSATYRAMRKQRIQTREYDFTFVLAHRAALAREEELLRLRRRLQLLSVI